MTGINTGEGSNITYAIPHGPYCYTVIGVDLNNGEPFIKTKICPFWSYSEPYRGYCSYLKISDSDYNPSGLLWDQVKECGVNE